MGLTGKTMIKVWSMILVIFALGIVTGIGISGFYRSPQHASAGSMPVKMASNDYLEQMKPILSLTPTQVIEMQKVLDNMRTEYKGVCAEVRPRYDALRERARGQLRNLLTSEQQQRFDQLATREDCNCPYLKK